MRDKLLDDDEIDLEMEKNSYSDRMRPRYSSKVHPTAKISYALSTISTVVQSMELSWHGVYVKPKHKNESGNIFSRIKNFAHQKIGEKKSEIHREHILQNAYGVAQPGEILALMGARYFRSLMRPVRSE
uniref:Uncharacterized protein n=1 Tax=Acrobeloides nanus TaxID=290746 RepID=A0A914D1Z9_9BILA